MGWFVPTEIFIPIVDIHKPSPEFHHRFPSMGSLGGLGPITGGYDGGIIQFMSVTAGLTSAIPSIAQ